MLFARGLRDISSSGAFFFFLFFLFYAARNTCFEARHAFSKAIQLDYYTTNQRALRKGKGGRCGWPDDAKSAARK